MTNPETSVFRECLEAMGEILLSFDQYVCEFDVCAYYDNREDMKLAACSNLRILARDCADHGYTVDWREIANCREFIK